MTREIKFRGLDKKGIWRVGSLVVTNAFIKHKPKQHSKTWIVTNSFGNGGWFNIRERFWVDPKTIGECLNVNGTQVFEGDIVKSYINIGVVRFGMAVDMTINCDEYGFDYCGWYLDLIDITDTDIESRCRFKDWIVIGNIHENPELLES